MEFVTGGRVMVRQCCCGYIKQLSAQSILKMIASLVKIGQCYMFALGQYQELVSRIIA